MRGPQFPCRKASDSRPPSSRVIRLAVLLLVLALSAAGALEIRDSWLSPSAIQAQETTLQKSAPPPSPPETDRKKIGEEVQINPDGYTSARVCGRCHVDIYNSWKNSMHAFSLADPIFDVAYMQALKEAGDTARRLCLRCHAPLTMANGDYDLRLGVTNEGVSCDFCHTVTDVQLENPQRPYVLKPGLVKRSVLRNAASPKHDVAYSALHAKSEFCGACHNYIAPNGTPVMTTYDEWRNGPYPAEGIQCQNCHMVLSAGKVVTQDIKESGPEIHLHDLIHDTNQLRGALDVEIVEAVRRERELRVTVVVKNVGSGHMVPTGIPSREIHLIVTVEVGGHTLRQDRRYRKVLADKNNRHLERDHEALLYAAQVVSDNRIAPREKRFERFTFSVPKSGKLNLDATLTYIYSPLLLQQKRMNIKLDHAAKSGL